MTVRVAIDLALDRLFTYEVPEALKEKLAVGQLLSVPFGYREARGFAMAVEERGAEGQEGREGLAGVKGRERLAGVKGRGGLAGVKGREGLAGVKGRERLAGVKGREGQEGQEAERREGREGQEAERREGQERQEGLGLGGKKDFALKPVTAIVDETPFFSPALLDLVKRVAAYYAAPLESVLKAALPAAVLKRNARAKEQLFVEPVAAAPGGPGGPGPGGPGGPGPGSLLSLSSLSTLRLSSLATLSPLSPLASRPGGQGQEGQEGRERQEAKGQEGRERQEAKGREGLERQEAKGQEGLERREAQGLACLARASARQRWLYEQIVRLGGGWLSQLCGELKTTPASLRGLAEKGLVTIAVKAKRRDPLGGRRILPTKPWPLNGEQSAALAAIAGATRPVLLFGVTGSGKTEVYLQAIAKELEAGRGAIVMVPEISLTPQTVQRFASRFGDRVAVLHSALSDGERYDEWHRIRAGKARVVVGPRSAVWAPVAKLGLIVVDEEHEASYKQEDNPRYHARDVAVLRAAVEGAKVVLGSATPSLESWFNVRRGKYALAKMACRAGAGRLPDVRLVDLSCGGAGGIFSHELLDALHERLDRHEQSILFINRRGYSRSLVCEACGYVMECPHCSLADKAMPYTYHQADNCLRCHVCGGWVPVPAACPQCRGAAFAYRGIGTQRAEQALKRCFPHARVLRMDADSTSRKSSHDDILGAFGRHEADVLIGTQMIAKGLDFPNVTLVGVLNADSSLNLPDFRASERTFQLLAQVSGRAGRAELPGEVVIQTYDPSAPAIQAARTGDYVAFAEQELKDRREAGFPPYTHLAVVTFRSRNLKLVGDWANLYAASLKRFPGLKTGGAVPCALEKSEDWYRWQLLLTAPSTQTIVRAWRWISGVRPPPKTLRIAIDADAFNLV